MVQFVNLQVTQTAIIELLFNGSGMQVSWWWREEVCMSPLCHIYSQSQSECNLLIQFVNLQVAQTAIIELLFTYLTVTD